MTYFGKWTTDRMGRRRVNGYTDLGPARIPPLPQPVGIEDRDNGALWILSQETIDGLLEPLLVTTWPRHDPNVAVYGPHDGPIIAGNRRLFVASGLLDSEPVTGQGLISTPRVFTRRGFSRTILELGWDGSQITYTPYTV